MVPPTEQTAPKPQKKSKIGKGKRSEQKHNKNHRGEGELGTGQRAKPTKSINPIGATQTICESPIGAKTQHKSEEKGEIGKGQKRERGNRDKANGEKTQSTRETNTIGGQGVKTQELQAQNLRSR